MSDPGQLPAAMPDTRALDAGVHRFLHTGPRTRGSGIPGAQTLHLGLATPAGWRDGPRIDVAVHVMGHGPDALLVHGWRADATDMLPLARHLAAAGRRVWMPDLPGHGQSGGEHLSLPLAAAALRAVQDHAGSFSFAAGHSYGGAALVHALSQGLQARRIALLAPATHYGFFARRAVAQSGLPEALWPAWLQRLSAIIGVDADTVNLRDQAQHIAVPAMVAHSSDDDIVPRRALEAAIACWPGVQWLGLEGLGHRGLLADDATLQAVGRFAGLP
ncbi:alpha/beta fold hydrolase [Piscinibacter sakaiensis]|uniref:Putative hydrolase n=1 Tax=Piscinibacter sakaiensis TaxID=1547922 RepID=A0A0K8NZR3_PISS1|nr:alpha/beta hydrolase [Piscinibacter sakaiensis]GAP35892.1 putative hydrolase [Piscinibacter sakaiensis]